MISCTCWNYTEGHLCKHCHKVWSSYCGAGEHQQGSQDHDQVLSLEQDNFGYHPEEHKEVKAGECTNIIVMSVC